MNGIKHLNDGVPLRQLQVQTVDANATPYAAAPKRALILS